MHSLLPVLLIGLPLALAPGSLQEGKGKEDPKTKAHAEIEKVAKSKGTQPKDAIEFYDGQVGYGIPSDNALSNSKTALENGLDIKNLNYLLRRKAEAGVRGTVLEKAITGEVNRQVEEKKKAKEEESKKKKEAEKGKKGDSGK